MPNPQVKANLSSTHPERAAVYVRISNDKTGERAGVTRQREDCIALARREGYEVRPQDIYEDNDISAYSGKKRPAYLALCEAIEHGSLDALIVWHPDRLHRSPLELEHFITLVEKTSLTMHTVTAGHIWDLTTPSGRMTARQLGAVARYESEHKAERQARALEQKAKEGRRHGPVPYGWRDGTAEEEAAVVQEMTARLLAGDSLRTITRDLNNRGIAAPRGGNRGWQQHQVRQVVMRASNAGLRVHKGEVIGQGQWPPLVSRDDWERVSRLLRDPRRRTAPAAVFTYPLSGLVRCGRCGGVMRHRFADGARRQKPIYVCADRLHLTIAARPLESFVAALVTTRLAEEGAARAISEASEEASEEGREASRLRREAAALDARLTALGQDFAQGIITRGAMIAGTQAARRSLAEVEESLRRLERQDDTVTAALRESSGASLGSLPPDRQRAVIDALCTLTVLPAEKKGRAFGPERVRVEWK